MRPVRAASLLGLGLLLALPGGATAEPDTKKTRRDGFAIGVGLGSGDLRGFGIAGVGGPGGALKLHVGTVAGPRMLWLLELGAAVDPQTDMEDKTTLGNQYSTLALGAQYYLREFIWTKAALGFAGLRLAPDPNDPDAAARRLSGLALSGAAGYDLFRSGMFVLDLDLDLNLGVFREGVVTGLHLLLSANWY